VLRALPPTAGVDEVPERAPNAATLPAARPVRRAATALAAGGPAAAAAGLSAFADAVDGGQPSEPAAT
jgi:hypothetical protein